ERALGHGDVSGRGNEGGELAVGHRGLVHLEGRDPDPVRRRLLGVVAVRAHQELAAGDAAHTGGRLGAPDRAVHGAAAGIAPRHPPKACGAPDSRARESWYPADNTTLSKL